MLDKKGIKASYHPYPTQALKLLRPLGHVVVIDSPLVVEMLAPLRVIATTTAPVRPPVEAVPWYNPTPPAGTVDLAKRIKISSCLCELE